MCYSGTCPYETFNQVTADCGCTKPEGEPCPWEAELEAVCHEHREELGLPIPNYLEDNKPCDSCPGNGSTCPLHKEEKEGDTF